MKLILLIFILAAAAFSLNVRFSEKPLHLQLYPRDANNKGTVIFAGAVLDLDKDSVVVVAARNNKPFCRVRTALTYEGDSAKFSIAIAIPAELSEFSFQCFVDTQLAASADSVVAGDVYIVAGQSNAAFGTCARNEHVRSIRVSDSAWFMTTEAGWGQLPGQIIENCHVPICAFNVAVPGSTIYQNSRNETNHYAGSYGAALLRSELGKVRNSVKMIFWYQGEWDAGYGAETGYPPQFDNLRNAWMEDYPALQKIYLVQINTWRSNGSREVREAERRISHLYSNVEIMTTIGALHYDGHGGYDELGKNLYRLVARDIYSSLDTVGIRAAEIQRAYYTTAARDYIALEFDQPLFWNAVKDSIVILNDANTLVPGYLKDYFAINDSTWESFDTCWFEQGNRRIVLKPKSGLSARNISYFPDWYNQRGCDGMSGPVLWNARHVSALTFTQFPVESPAVYDTGTLAGLTLSAPKSLLSIFETMPLTAIASYAGGRMDTNHYVTFSTQDTFVVRVDDKGVVRGMNPGTAEVIAGKDGLLDTLEVTVGSGFAAMKSMAFKPAERTLVNGSSMPVGLLGDFNGSGKSVRLNLDTLAAFDYSGSVLAVENGVVRALGTADSTRVIASFGGQRCTLLVKMPGQPSFLRRINFQPKGDSITRIAGWAIDSGMGYSAGIGYGWAAPDPNSQHCPKIANYLRATSANGNRDYKIDCPDGDYLIRFCVATWVWAEPGIIRRGSDTLVVNPQPHEGTNGVPTEGQIWVADVRVTVTGGAGLTLNIFGGICYLVMISDDGADLNAMAKDDRVDVVPFYPTEKEKMLEAEQAMVREPRGIPNPFNPTTRVAFALPKGVSAVYTLYDIRGRRVFDAKLVRSSIPQVRNLTLDFGALNGNKQASGTYFGRLICSDGKRFTHSLVLIR